MSDERDIETSIRTDENSDPAFFRFLNRTQNTTPSTFEDASETREASTIEDGRVETANVVEANLLR